MHWLDVNRKYDAERKASRMTFLNRVTRHKLFDIAKRNGAQQRDMTKVFSLDQLLENDEEGFEKYVMFDDQKFKQMLNTEFSRVLIAALDSLSCRQKKICRLLSEKGLTQLEISQQLKIPRATLHDEIKRIKEAFVKEGVDYLWQR